MPNAITLTLPLARAAAQDAANRQMHAAGRTAWSLEDYKLAARELDRLAPMVTTLYPRRMEEA